MALDILSKVSRGRRGRDRMQSVPITTDVVSSNLDQGEVQHYMIKFVSDL
jgi:hypothetical protein